MAAEGSNKNQSGVAEDSAPWCTLISQEVQTKRVSICENPFIIKTDNVCDLVIRQSHTDGESILLREQKGDSLEATICYSEKVQLDGKTVCSYQTRRLNSGDELIISCDCRRIHSYIFRQLPGEVAKSDSNTENKIILIDYSSHSVSSSNTLLSEAFDNFPYKLSDKTKYLLVANALFHTKTLQNKKSTEKLNPSQRAKILLSGPAGSEMYQEKLCRALANYFRSKCLVFDSLLSPVLTAPKHKIASKSDSPSVGDLSKPSFRVGDRVIYTGLNIGHSRAVLSNSGPTFGSRGKIVLRFGNSQKIGVIFDTAIDQGIDLGGECERGCGFFCYVDEVVLEPKDGDFVKLLSPILYEAIEFGRMKSPLFLFIKDIKKFLEDSSSLNSPPKEDMYGKEVAISTKSVIDKLSKHAIVIGSHMNTDENKKVVATPQLVAEMFPCQIAIDMPEHEEHFKELEHHFETEAQKIISVKNKKLLQNISIQRGLTFKYSEALCIADHVLTVKSAQNIIDCALGYEVMHSADKFSKSEGVLSEESISYGISTIRTEKTNLLAELNDFEKKILEDSVLHSKFGVTFDDIGAHDGLKANLKRVVMQLLKTHTVSSKGLTAKGCKGILLFGPPGTGKTMLAKAVAIEAGASFISFAIRNIRPKWLGDYERYTDVVFSVAAGKLSPCVIFVDEADIILGKRPSIEDDTRRQIINEFILNWDGLGDNARVVVLLASNKPSDLDNAVIRRLNWRFMVKLPDVSERSKILKLILADENLSSDVNVEELANMTPNYSGSDLKNLCEFAANCPLIEIIETERLSKLHDKSKASEIVAHMYKLSKRKASHISKFRPLNRDDFRYAKERTSATSSSELSISLEAWNQKFNNSGSQMDNLNCSMNIQMAVFNTFEKWILQESVVMSSEVGVKFDDIGALDNVKDALKELVVRPFKSYQLSSMGQLSKVCKGILLFGPPGTGKTTLVKAVVTEAGANLINVSMATFFSTTCQSMGQTIQYIKAVFSVASKIAPCVIFIDEVDNILGKKSSTYTGMFCTVKDEFISAWDGLVSKETERVIVVAVTNRPYELDDHVIRRLAQRFLVNLPDVSSRSKILRVILAKLNMSPDFDFNKLATLTPDYSGSDLKNLCMAAANLPPREFTENKKEETKTDTETEAGDVKSLNMEDCIRAKEQVTASSPSTSSMMMLLLEWNDKYGNSRVTPTYFQ